MPRDAMSSALVKTVSMEMPLEYPLAGKDTKVVLQNFGTLFILAVKHPKEYSRWIHLPGNAELLASVDALIEWSGDPDEQAGNDEDAEEEE